ncbi:MAG: hypothetical protein IKW33_04855, partial [Clostridia bacterium]|nr:hypothetical protein [Clostridia bacterium]
MTKKVKKWVKYSTTILVIVVMFISSMPFSILKAFADELKVAGETNTTANTFVQPDKLESTNIDDKSALENAYILDENVENRTLNSKEFVMSDGSVIVQNFAQNVHYLEDGDYKEIDNTLVEVKDENGKSAYENTANFYKVKISKDFEPNNSLIKLDNGENGLDFTYIESSVKNTVAQKKSGNSAKTQNQYKGKKLKAPKDFSTGEGKISYNNISEDIDLEYEVKDNGVKENIVVKDYLADYNFDFKVKTTNLFLQKMEDGSIIALDSVGKVKYVIPVPFMFDANGEYNYDVEYILNKVGNDYFLTISADEDWIEKEASLPVTIDPIVEIKNDNSFSFVNVYEKGTGTQSSSEVYVGEKESGNKSNAYFSFSVSNTSKNYTLVSATVSFHIRTEGMGIFNWKNIKYSACIVDSAMPLLNITYTNRPERLQYLGLLGADTNLAPTEGTNHLPIDINLIDGNPITLGLEREANNSVGAYVRVFVTGTNGIYLTCRYKQITGLDESYSTESAEINGATAYVNKASRALTLNLDVASVNNSSQIPLSASLVYNTNYNDIFNELGVATMFGNNIKLNFQQFVRQTSEYIALYDSDGSVTMFNYDKLSNLYRTIDGKLIATVVGTKITIFDAQQNRRIFNNGRLTELYKGEETTSGSLYIDRLKIKYVAGSGTDKDKISEIQFYSGGANIESSSIALTYSGTRVSTITTNYCFEPLASYNLTYDSNGNLIGITNVLENVEIYSLDYDTTNGNLTGVYNKDYEGLCFTYETEENTENISAIVIDQVVGKSANNAKKLDCIKIDFSKHYSYVETYYYQNNKNVSTSYVCFDSFRNPISEWSKDEDGKVRGVNRGNYNFNYVASRDYYDYFKEDVAFEEKLNTTFESCSLQAGGTATGSVNSGSGIVNNTYYRYGLTFYVECDSYMDLTVTFGTYSKRIILKSGGKLYVTLPCGYVQTGTFTFKNNGFRVTNISNVTYNVIDYVKTTNTYGVNGNNYGVYVTAETISYNRKGEYEQKLYDGLGRLVTLNKRSIQDDVLETTTYVYNTTDVSKNNQIESITTKRNGTTTLTQNYTYFTDEETGEREDTIITNASGLKKKSVEKTEIRDGGFVSISIDENNVSTERTYNILGGDIRLETLKSGRYIQKYTYDGFGDVTSITLYSGNNEILRSENYFNIDNEGMMEDETSTCEKHTLHCLGDDVFAKHYDSLGFLTKIEHNEEEMLSYDYVD